MFNCNFYYLMTDFKVLKYLCAILLMVVAVQVNAQNAEEVTDEELKGYAEVMYKVDQMKAEAKEKYVELIKGHELMQKGKRFNEIKKAKGDEAVLAELGVTEEEMAAYNEILAENDKFKVEIKEAFNALVKEDLGAGTYNKVKRQLKSDEELKVKYDEVYASVESADQPESDTDEEEED